MIQAILNYQEMLNEIPKLFNKSHFKKGYIIEQIGMTTPTFYRKLNSKNFTPDELLKLAKILVPEEYYQYELEQELSKGLEDIKQGKTITKEKAMSDLRHKLV